MILSFINIRKVPANVNEWKIMFARGTLRMLMNDKVMFDPSINLYEPPLVTQQAFLAFCPEYRFTRPVYESKYSLCSHLVATYTYLSYLHAKTESILAESLLDAKPNS